MLTEGTILQSRYRIVRQLGQGGMGAVYEAIDERLDTTVALKETLFTEEKLRKQFEREARLLARLHHQALPRVSDHFTEGEGQFLVMQYIPGEDLLEMLVQHNGPFPQDEVLRWADQLCDALDYLHTQDPQIIHRDIKPQNLKLTARGQIVLLDFGLAKGSVGTLTAVTTSASIFGYTPNYAPLEQIQGQGTDPRSDIYSLSATLFHLLTNLKPPDALSRAGAVVNGQPDPLPLANQVRPDISAAVANVLSKAMSQKRDDRFANANAMRDALRLAMTDQTLSDADTVQTKGAGFASTNTVSSESATRLVNNQTQPLTRPVISSEAKTLVAGETTNVETVASGETATVVRTANRNWIPLIAAASLLVILGGAALGFYAYRQRRLQATVAEPVTNDAQSSQSSKPEVSSEPGNNAVPANQTETAKVNEKSARTNEKPKTDTATQRSATTKGEPRNEPAIMPPIAIRPDEPVHDPNRDPNRARENRPPPRDQPPFDPMRGVPPPRPPGHPPDMRVLRNGTRIIRRPDGTFIMVKPDGSTTVFTPGQKPKRNSNSNNP